MTRSTELTPLVLGRPSAAAAAPAQLRSSGESTSAGYRADGGDSRWCSLRAASVAGVRHRLVGQPCEDAFAWAAGDARVVVAVGDGLGSIPGSGATSARATLAAVQTAMVDAVGPADGPGAHPEVPARPTSGGPPPEGERAGPVIDAIGVANRAAVGGGATTLVVAVVPEEGPVLVGRVGDSTAFVVEATGAVRELFAPPDDGTVTTGTDALPADDPAVETTTTTLPLGAVLVLATDGAADPWRDGPTTVAPAFADTLIAAPTPLELLRLVDFSRQGCHDDRTVVALWRRADPDPFVAGPLVAGPLLAGPLVAGPDGATG